MIGIIGAEIQNEINNKHEKFTVYDRHQNYRLNLLLQGSCLYWAIDASSPLGPWHTKSAKGLAPISVSWKLSSQFCASWSKSFSLILRLGWLFPTY